MSTSFEKETTASTAKSLVGALVALGAGFVFMFLGLVTVTASSTKAQGDQSAQALVGSLQSDLIAYQAGSVQISKDQKTLKFRRQGDGKPEEITYKVTPDSGEVFRSVGAEGQKLGKLSEVRFENAGGLVRLYWRSPTGESKASWALNRWQGKEKP
jgi:hypothetical protein